VAFWDEKITCEHCNKKAKKKTSLYRRGSQFCSQACLGSWEAQNPPPVARGDHASLRHELIIVLDEAFTEANRRFGPSLGIEFGTSSVVLTVGFVENDPHQAEMMNTAFQLFQSHTLRAAPILRALGYTREATMIDSHNFLEQPSEPLARELANVRRQL
jgi:hypothetical protein